MFAVSINPKMPLSPASPTSPRPFADSPVFFGKSVRSKIHIATRSKLRILFVDDSEMERQITTARIKKLGFKGEIDVAVGCDEACDFYSRKEYDLIFLDHDMPPGADGDVTANKIRQMSHQKPHRLHHAPVIVSRTSNEGDAFRAKCKRAGMDYFLVKPSRMDELLASVKAFFIFDDEADISSPVLPSPSPSPSPSVALSPTPLASTPPTLSRGFTSFHDFLTQCSILTGEKAPIFDGTGIILDFSHTPDIDTFQASIFTRAMKKVAVLNKCYFAIISPPAPCDLGAEYVRKDWDAVLSETAKTPTRFLVFSVKDLESIQKLVGENRLIGCVDITKPITGKAFILNINGTNILCDGFGTRPTLKSIEVKLHALLTIAVQS